MVITIVVIVRFNLLLLLLLAIFLRSPVFGDFVVRSHIVSLKVLAVI